MQARELSTDAGSSPLTRGKPARRGLEGMVRRLIPAHAGKTNPWSAEACQRAAHPRSRGENGLHGAFDVQRAGSSPLTRGKPACHERPQDWPRLIPAHAGKT